MLHNAKEQKGKSLQLWYGQPAGEWTEALPIGNGRIGAMIFGGTESEKLQLNEDTLYAGEPGMRSLPLSIHEHFDEVLSFIKRGKYADAGDIIKREWLGRAQTCYQALGDVDVSFFWGGRGRGLSSFAGHFQGGRSRGVSPEGGTLLQRVFCEPC